MVFNPLGSGDLSFYAAGQLCTQPLMVCTSSANVCDVREWIHQSVINIRKRLSSAAPQFCQQRSRLAKGSAFNAAVWGWGACEV